MATPEKARLRVERSLRRNRYWLGYWLPMVVAGAGLAALRPRRARPTQFARIGIVINEHIGDAIISVPMIRALRTRHPHAFIVAMVSASAFPILELCPYLDRVIPVPPVAGWWGGLRGMLKFGSGLSSLELDLLIVPKNMINDRFAELAAIAIPARWKRSMRSPQLHHQIKPLRFRPLYDEVLTTDGDRHEAEFRLMAADPGALSEGSLQTESWTSKAEDAFASQFLRSACSAHPGGRPVGFGIGAPTAKRLWPLSSYARVIDELVQRFGIVPILIVGPNEVPKAESLRSMLQGPAYFCRAATVRQSLAILRGCHLFVGNDSGPMHMAASAGIPVIEISCHPVTGPARSGNSPVRFGPLCATRIILQPTAQDPQCAEKGCQHENEPHCVALVEPQTVIEAASTVLAARDRVGAPKRSDSIDGNDRRPEDGCVSSPLPAVSGGVLRD